MTPGAWDDLLRGLHDAELCTVSMDRGNQKLELGFNKSDGTTCNLKFTRVLTSRINNILYQNVVSRILFWD